MFQKLFIKEISTPHILMLCGIFLALNIPIGFVIGNRGTMVFLLQRFPSITDNVRTSIAFQFVEGTVAFTFLAEETGGISAMKYVWRSDVD